MTIDTENKNGKWITTVGLEIHAELNTKTKMFCNSKNDPDEVNPNVNVCPVCMGHPGTLPTINMEAISHMVKIGLAVNGEIANFTEFDRKNYFYPDIPKGYQISQFKYPIVSGGELAGVKLTRIHLEEDTGTSKHDQGNYSLVDFNRAGIPLMELVTEPVIHSAEQAGKFARELQTLLRFLGVAEANLEKGEMRVEVNVSISDDPNKLGTKVEVKNINSFKAAEKAIDFEVERMIALHEAGRGDEIVQETRGWDETKSRTFSQRSKEDAHDYRYFPDPDLPKMQLHEIFDLEEIKAELPELPNEKRDRYRDQYGIKDEDIESYITDDELATFFENTIILFDDNKDLIKLASNYITSDIVGIRKNSDNPDIIFEHITYQDFAKLIQMNNDGDLNSRGTKDILALMIQGKGTDPQKLAEEHNMLQENDAGALEEIVKTILSENAKAVEDLKGGNENSLKFLMGQVMKATKGSANPKMATDLIKKLVE